MPYKDDVDYRKGLPEKIARKKSGRPPGATDKKPRRTGGRKKKLETASKK